MASTMDEIMVSFSPHMVFLSGPTKSLSFSFFSDLKIDVLSKEGVFLMEIFLWYFSHTVLVSHRKERGSFFFFLRAPTPFPLLRKMAVLR